MENILNLSQKTFEAQTALLSTRCRACSLQSFPHLCKRGFNMHVGREKMHVSKCMLEKEKGRGFQMLTTTYRVSLPVFYISDLDY